MLDARKLLPPPVRGRLSGGVLAAALAVAAFTTACADAPSAPVAAAPSAPSLARARRPQDSTATPTVLATAGTAQGLTRTRPLAAPVTTRFVVTPLGGLFTLPGTGLSVLVPPFAHPSGPITITATAVPGDVVAYEFEPHGTVFARPLVAVQDLTATNWQSRGAGPTYDVGYFADPADLHPETRTALVRELLPRTVDFLGVRLVFQVQHFSGYMVSWGFRDRDWD